MKHCCFSGCQMVTCNACGEQFCVRFQMHVCPGKPTAGSSDYPSSAPNGENAGYRKGGGGHGE